MVIYSKYIDSKLHDWYDSSNLLYSKCYDTNGPTVNLIIVFSDGRTYRYKDVDKHDFYSFKTAQSNGKAFSQFIRPKYKGERIMDTPKEKLDELRESYINMERNIEETRNSDLVYEMRYDNETGDVALYLGGRRIFRGKENEISIINLFQCMNIRYGMKEGTEEDFKLIEDEEKLTIND